MTALFPVAAFAAALKSESLVEELIVVPSALAFVVIASRGYNQEIVSNCVSEVELKQTAVRYGNSAVPLPHPTARTPALPPLSVNL